MVCALWYLRENRKLAERWQTELPTDLAHSLIEFTWRRSLQFFAVLLCALLAMAIYSWQLTQSQKALEHITIERNDHERKMNDLKKQVKAATDNEIKLKDEIKRFNDSKTANAQKDQPSSYYPPTAQSGIEALYSPENVASGSQAEVDRLKKQYEEILVNNMYLKKCGKAQPTDIHIIISALSQAMASVNAPGRLQYDILTSARGSYNEIYSKSACDTKEMVALNAQYRKYIDAISKQLSD